MVNRLSFRQADGTLLCEARLPDREVSLTVGRTPDCDVILPVITISRHHLAVHRAADGSIRVEDLQSRYGTMVEGTAMPPRSPVPVGPGCRIQLAAEIFLEIGAGEGEDGVTADGSRPAGSAPGFPRADGRVVPMFSQANQETLDQAFARLQGKLPPDCQEVLAECRAAVTGHLERLAYLLDTVFTLNSITDFQRLLERTIELALAVTGAERGYVILYQESEQRFRTVAASGMGKVEADQKREASQTLIMRCFERREPVLFRDTDDDPGRTTNDSIAIRQIRSAALAPLSLEDRVIGVLYLDSRRRADAFNPYVLKILSVFASHASVAIYNSRLLTLATTDGMTGLTNHRTFMHTLTEEFHRSRRSGQPLSLVLFDLDHFKAVNDRRGHLAGDQVLRTLGAILREATPPGGQVARYGGEEFAMLLPGRGADEAGRAAGKVRSLLACSPVEIEGGEPLVVTVSAGVAILAAAAMPNPAALIQAADGALYQAKKDGRNRVVLASEPLPGPLPGGE